MNVGASPLHCLITVGQLHSWYSAAMLRYVILCYAILRPCSCGLNSIGMLHPHTYTAPHYYTAYGLRLWLKHASYGHYRWMQGVDWIALSTERTWRWCPVHLIIIFTAIITFLFYHLEVHVYITQSALALFTDASLLHRQLCCQVK